MPDLRVQPDDPAYIALARAEAAWWGDRPNLTDLSDVTGDPLVAEHYNRRFTGDPRTRWFETIATYGPFERGLILGGAGLVREAAILESNPTLHATFTDISDGVLRARDQQFQPRFASRFDTRLADLNFIDLPENAYDFILSSSVIHHVTNLEHLAAQVQRALTPDGYFFFEDFVGESKRHFLPEKRLAYELVYNREMTRQGRTPAQLTWPIDDVETSPFCCIRSGDILGVLREHLHEQDLRTAGALWPCVLYARDPRLPATFAPRARPGKLHRLASHAARRLRRKPAGAAVSSPASIIAAEFTRRLLDVGDRLSDAGAITPSQAFAIYRKQPPA